MSCVTALSCNYSGKALERWSSFSWARMCTKCIASSPSSCCYRFLTYLRSTAASGAPTGPLPPAHRYVVTCGSGPCRSQGLVTGALRRASKQASAAKPHCAICFAYSKSDPFLFALRGLMGHVGLDLNLITETQSFGQFSKNTYFFFFFLTFFVVGIFPAVLPVTENPARQACFAWV